MDDCGITDALFADILKGLLLQGRHLKKISYINNTSIGAESIEVIKALMPQLDEINIHNPAKGVNDEDLHDLLDSALQDGRGLLKLKLSKLSLNNATIVNKICQIHEQN